MTTTTSLLVNPQRSISISCCSDYSAVLISPDMKIMHGIDIEPIHSKILKVTQKFMNIQEHNEWEKTESVEKAIAYWTFKEAIFKAYGKRYITLRENIHINSFQVENAQTNGMIKLKSRQ